MPEAALLPTNRDEAWRYSDIDALQDTAPDTFEAWEDVRVAEGETWSDLIVLDADPLTDIRNTLEIDQVMQRGEWVERDGLLPTP